MEENKNMPGYINLSEFNYSQAKDSETLKKISFFLSNSEVNPYEYMVNPENGNFYKIATKEIYEVRKNSEGNYELYNENEAAKAKKEEKEAPVEKKDIKIRRLSKPKETPKEKNAAYAKNIFVLVTTIIVTIAFITLYIALKK